MKIYTKTGDQGKTSLFGKSNVQKNDLRVKAYGEIDEVNACLGTLRATLSKIEKNFNDALLKDIQNRLFDIGAELATANENFVKKLPRLIQETDITKLEKEIDFYSEELPVLKNFILPGGHIGSAQAHLARCVTRRAERSIIALAEKKTVRSEIIKYVNRLSDYFFVLARKINFDLDVEDIEWEK